LGKLAKPEALRASIPLPSLVSICSPSNCVGVMSERKKVKHDFVVERLVTFDRAGVGKAHVT